MKVQRLLILLLVCFHSFLYASESPKHSHKQIVKVVDDFMLAIKNKDEQSFTDLFYSNNVPWLGVNPEKRKGNLPSNDGIIYATHLGFIGWIASSEENIEEKYWDLTIKSDGEIASVYFKYSFHIGDYKMNWGDETWDLIKTIDGWKIVSVIYSATYNPNPRSDKN
ncbi:hypothetical protein MHM95_03480 [Pseudoalteromonas sp. CnMc7-15]|uniref:hypothetical protein n=1 Tax=unclassified Pseudoalteromonas TaxID=194690 RepID=UPI001EF4DEDC|nr:hypothetical protein [Pseudoalteromonas sp. CnMc7-15]MCG7565349.1 hypothetical protein [Pseudoalteromonas sp. CnMc7-15]